MDGSSQHLYSKCQWPSRSWQQTRVSKYLGKSELITACGLVGLRFLLSRTNFVEGNRSTVKTGCHNACTKDNLLTCVVYSRRWRTINRSAVIERSSEWTLETTNTQNAAPPNVSSISTQVCKHCLRSNVRCKNIWVYSRVVNWGNATYIETPNKNISGLWLTGKYYC